MVGARRSSRIARHHAIAGNAGEYRSLSQRPAAISYPDNADIKQMQIQNAPPPQPPRVPLIPRHNPRSLPVTAPATSRDYRQNYASSSPRISSMTFSRDSLSGFIIPTLQQAKAGFHSSGSYSLCYTSTALFASRPSTSAPGSRKTPPRKLIVFLPSDEACVPVHWFNSSRSTARSSGYCRK